MKYLLLILSLITLPAFGQKRISEYPNTNSLGSNVLFIVAVSNPGDINWTNKQGGSNYNVAFGQLQALLGGGGIAVSNGFGTNTTLFAVTNSGTSTWVKPGQNTSVWSWNNSDNAWEFTGGLESDGTLATYGGLLIFADNATRIGNLTGGGLFIIDTNTPLKEFVFKGGIAYGDGTGLTNVPGESLWKTNAATGGMTSAVTPVEVTGALVTDNGFTNQLLSSTSLIMTDQHKGEASATLSGGASISGTTLLVSNSVVAAGANATVTTNQVVNGTVYTVAASVPQVAYFTNILYYFTITFTNPTPFAPRTSSCFLLCTNADANTKYVAGDVITDTLLAAGSAYANANIGNSSAIGTWFNASNVFVLSAGGAGDGQALAIPIKYGTQGGVSTPSSVTNFLIITRISQ